ncbi:MAG: hypothetical protein M0P02_01215 [Sulfurospirillaceae bacterium]|jgi:hypothetical protein|nr:hypothetical protein [Sulfurospirillaceae bacterium]NLN00216.1 hypothetical protein [Campylobacteraceae bacterium]
MRVLSIATFLLFLLSTLEASVLFVNEEVVGEKSRPKIEALGNELYEKSGILTGVVALESLSGKTKEEYFKELSLTPPFAIIFLTKKEHQVDILASSDVLKLFDKDAILSPLPWRGTILPILSSKKGDYFSAAMLNGYADLVEQIAQSKNIELKEAVGSSNKKTFGLLKIIFYGVIFWAAAVIISRKVKRYGTYKK